MRENNDLGIFDFDDFAMEMTSTELLLVNGGACGGGFSGSSGGYSGGYSGSYSSGSSSASSSCGGASGSSSGSSSSSVSSSCGGSSGSYSSGSSSASSSCGGASGSSSGSSSSSVSSSCGGSSSSYSGSSSSVSSSCGGSFNGGNGSVSYGNCGGGTIPISNNCGGGYTGSGTSYTSSGCGGGNVPTITDRITTSIEQNLDKKYNKNNDGYKCDNWVQEVLTDAGLDYNDYFAGDAYQKKVKDHIADLKSKGTGNYTSKIPSKAGVYVVFMDGTGSLGTLDPHCGILEVNSNGTMYFTHNSSSNTAAGVGGGVWTEQTYSQNNGTKLSGLAYSNFYFQEIKL